MQTRWISCEGVGLRRDRGLGSPAPRGAQSAGMAGTVPFGGLRHDESGRALVPPASPRVPRAALEADGRRAAFLTEDGSTLLACPGCWTPFDLSEGRLAGGRRKGPKRAQLAECPPLPVPGFGSRFGHRFRRRPLDPRPALGPLDHLGGRGPLLGVFRGHGWCRGSIPSSGTRVLGTLGGHHSAAVGTRVLRY